MTNKIISFCKSITNGAVARFRTEELFFGISAIGTIIIDYGSVVPALSVICLLAFYYLFFGWYMFATLNEKHVLFSIISGIIYSVCLLTMALIIVGRDSYNGFFYLIQLILVTLLAAVLYRNNWGMYKGNHFIRMGLILLLNIYILLFK